MTRLVFACVAILAVACGKHGSGSTTDGNGGGDDGNGPVFDAFVPARCANGPDPSKPQCSNCIDDDNDGFMDEFDVNCTGPLDDDESSFKTGIPGDNVDPVKQDCFFDGDSGAGNDGCNIHVCCLLGAATKADCPLGANSYDPTKCPPPLGTTPLSQNCIDTCGAITPPGCDCFGCCTICDPGTNMCFDILTNPAVSPDCTSATIGDPTKCLRCTKETSCGNGTCGGATCILCPGQDASDLPPSCNGMVVCPAGQQACPTGSCPTDQYCSAGGCCVNIIL